MPCAIVAATVDTWEETEYVPFEWTFDGVNSSYTAGTQVRVTLDTMKNPVSGAETEATLSLPSGLISKTIHTTSTKAFAIFSKGLKMAAPGKYGFYCIAEHGN